MKKILSIAMAAAMVLSFAACSSKQDSSSEEVKEPTVATGTYTVYNTTGDKITELYLHEAGSEDKGENLAGEGLADTASVELKKEGAVDFALVLEFTTESGYTGSFDTLHNEVAPISLLSEDAAAGATVIKFAKPE